VELFGYDDNKAIEIVVITKVTGLMKVLFAEDDHKVGKHVKDALTAEGYAVKWVEDGHEALWLAENYHFDLIVLDIMLPERDGISILRYFLVSPTIKPVMRHLAFDESD